MSKTVREVTFQLLRELGLTTVFGNPGSTEETFLKDFPEDFTYIQTLAEAAAVGAADGFAQANRVPAIVNVHTSAGLSNAMSNILTAAMNHTPLIITAGNQTREMLLMEPWLTNIEPTMLPKPWVKWSYEPARAEDVPAAFMRALAIATQPPAGPVFLSIPLDDWDKLAGDANPVVRTVSHRIAPDPERLAEFGDILSTAKNPVLIYGAAIARGQGWDEAIALAEKLNAPVWAAPASERTPFPEDHPLYAGGLPFAMGPLSDKLEGHDVAIVIGAPVFRYYPYVPGNYVPKGMRLLHVTDDPSEAGKAPVGESMLGDPVLTLQGLTEQVAARSLAPAVSTQSHNMAPHAVAPAGNHEQMSALELFEILRSSAPANTVLVEESPSNLAELHTAWPVTLPDSFFTFASGSLGWNLPAAVGIALAEKTSGRNRPVLAVIGDGSLQYSIQALWTAAQQQLPLLVVVPCNAEYAILKSFAVVEDTPGVPGLDIPGLDIVALGNGYGCHGVSASTPEDIAREVEAAFTRNGPTVLAVPVAPTIPPLL
ncbi:benzoylformate decarboxylase [Aurantimicrobium minutum]|uniref:benzoylformate decarboxylase n=1 Tax=Aurantimicrobium minutum TaxID=708131 RepID=UPI0024057EAE|nr:benzoylformate decarboxylase [Aurantimicrobium minutum]MDF9809866.1 benzoylformate decarboxylase [Aurantimicrobium minutum]